MAFLTKNKAKIHYKVFGDEGQWMVLINGFTRPSSDFRMMARYFSEQGYRVLIFDNRGAGDSESLDSFTLETIAEDIGELIRVLSIESCHLIGFSMGGIIARCFAHKFPKALASLTLVASPFDSSFLNKSSAGFLDLSQEAIEEGFAHYVAEDFFKKNRLVFKAMAKKIFLERDKSYRKSFMSQKDAVQKTKDIFYTVPQDVSSILILHGDCDKVVPLDHAYLFEKNYPRVHLELLSGAGHLLLIEKTKELYQMILSFLQRVKYSS